MTHKPENIQKLLRAGSDVNDPRKNASPSVNDVIVIDGPACIRPFLKRSFGSRCRGVWSILLTIT